MGNEKSLVAKLRDKSGGIVISTLALSAIHAAVRGFSDGVHPQPLPLLESTLWAGANAASTGFAGSSQEEKSPTKTRNWTIAGAVGSEACFWVVYSAAYWIGYAGDKLF